jgi:hypothetical protein
VFLGASRYYAPGGLRRVYLGARQLSLYTFPKPSGYDGLTGSWMDQMSGSGGPDCSSSAAMQVACWEDQHGIHGDIVVVPKDTDDDGYYDDVDAQPSNPYYY